MRGPDPETEDIKKSSREYRASSCFTCAWTKGQLCRGYIMQMDVTDAEALAGQEVA